MSATLTRNASFTLTEARYIAAKVGADLRMLHNLYGKPALDTVDLYVEEVALLLRDGYLKTVDFGFRSNSDNAWKLRLRYTATLGGHLTDDRPGRLPTAADVAGLPFYSFLVYSAKYDNLPASEKQKVEQALPLQRVGAAEPSASFGTFTSGHGYSRNGTGVNRDIYTAF
jgi:hypothetical protein